jgi:general secretion pathway protein G
MNTQPSLFVNAATGIRRAARRGLTLIEIMVVIALLGILATIIGGSMMGAFDDNAAEAAKIQMKQVGGSLQMYALRNKGRYPKTSDGLAAAKKYFPDNKVPKDPWGSEFLYYSPGTHSEAPFELVCLGKDGREGGEDANADIKSWELE